ncbi:CBS domain-containing protein [Thermosulfuriphilus sp.]
MAKKITLITSHINADFDALSAMVAAKILYKEAVLAFPGATEKGLRHFVLEAASYLVEVRPAREINLDQVGCLVIVDVNDPERLGPFASLLKRKDIEIHLYDHHPEPAGGGIPAHRRVIRPYGSATAVLVEIIRDRGIRLSKDEATIIALGIYEDTGSFTYPSTTPADLMAAAWLLEQGADLNTVGQVVRQDLSAEQVDLLNQLLDSAVRFNIQGIEIVLAKAKSSRYIDEFAVVAQKFMDIEDIPVVFALAQMNGRIYVVGRSRLDQVNVAEILTPLGGGGHPQAAAASVKGMTILEVEEAIVNRLSEVIRPPVRAKDLMSAPAITIEASTTIEEAHRRFTETGAAVFPVLKEGQVYGLISREVVEKALYHHFEESLVSDFMTKEFEVLSPEDPLSRIMEIIVSQRQRLAPVLKDGYLIGVVTRTDLLNYLAQEKERRPEKLLPERRRERDLRKALEKGLPGWLISLLKMAGEVAEDLGYNAYVVGGFVRDLLLGEKNLDVDIVIEGDGTIFAKRLAGRLSGRVSIHEKFKTAVITLPSGFKIDVATARWEYYAYPAALPTVELSSLKLDLFRRDFTINTLAIKLNPNGFGQLVDFFGGLRDLKDGVIQVLHSLSFIEDPTRIFRAIRFATRYGFRIGRHTLDLLRGAVRLHLIDRLSGRRLLNELRHILSERDPLPAIKQMAELELLPFIHQNLNLTEKGEELIKEIEASLSWYRLQFAEEAPQAWLVYLLGLLDPLDQKQFAQALKRLEIPERKMRRFTEERNRLLKALKDLERVSLISRSQIYRYLEGLLPEMLLYGLAKAQNPAVKQAIALFLRELRKVRLEISGRDLKALGLPEGPIYREILEILKEAKIDGLVKTKEEELEFAKGLLLKRAKLATDKMIRGYPRKEA